MKFSIMDCWSLVMSGVLSTVRQGINIGAFGPKIDGRPWIEWAYQAESDSLYVLLFDHKPVEASQPYEQVVLAEFGASCFRMAEGLAPFAVALEDSYPSPNAEVGFRSQAKGPEDFIGFRRPGS